MFSWASAIFGSDGAIGSEPITTKSTVRGSVNHSGIEDYAFSGMQGWRLTMEDAHMACTEIPVAGSSKSLAKGHAIFGVMDGHGGDFTSEFAAANFMKIFSQNANLKKYAKLDASAQQDVPGIQLLKPALSETFMVLDTEIRKKQNKRNDDVMLRAEKMEKGPDGMPVNRLRFERSGSTCVVVMITPSHIICANAGDSRAVLRRNGKALPLSFDHKPSNVPELDRIQDAGGFVKSKRVDGDLAVSRGLGDYSYKSNERATVDKQKVIPDPEFVVYPRDRKLDEYVILACDGIWDVATNEQCSDFVQEVFDEGEQDLGLICEEAIDSCLERNSRDNMTITLITFEGAHTPSGNNLRNAVWQRRTARKAREFEESARAVATRAAAGVGFAFGTSDSSPSVTVSSGSK